jgi:hypothetical protein
MQRHLELDAARGLMLVWITFTHLPTVVSAYVNQPLGFVSAAEGFIFLSALFTGLIYSRLAAREGYPAMERRLGLRTLRLYGYHALMLAFTFTVAVPLAEHGNRPGLHNLLDFYFVSGPTRAIVDAALLVYRPPLLDILPMYILFLLLTGLVLALASRIPWKLILGVSFLFWILAQIGFRQISDDWLTGLIGPHIPLRELGAFDLWAWQFLWVVGVWMGVRWSRRTLDLETWAHRLSIPAALVTCVLLALRYAVGRGVELGSVEICFDKWHLGVFRLIDFAAIAALLIRFRSILRCFAIRPLIMLGQASLQVFCAHLMCCFFGLTLLGSASMLSGFRQFALVAITLSAMFVTARIFARSEPVTSASPSAGPSHRPAATRTVTA